MKQLIKDDKIRAKFWCLYTAVYLVLRVKRTFPYFVFSQDLSPIAQTRGQHNSQYLTPR